MAFSYFVALMGTFANVKGDTLDRAAGALCYPSMTHDGARGHVRTLLGKRAYSGSPVVIIEVDPPIKQGGAIVGREAMAAALVGRTLTFEGKLPSGVRVAVNDAKKATAKAEKANAAKLAKAEAEQAEKATTKATTKRKKVPAVEAEKAAPSIAEGLAAHSPAVMLAALADMPVVTPEA